MEEYTADNKMDEEGEEDNGYDTDTTEQAEK
jgi:hypothetical protein